MIGIFFGRMQEEIKSSLANSGLTPSVHEDLTKLVYDQARVKFNETSHMDSTTRFTEVLRPIVTDVLEFLSKEGGSHSFDALAWKTSLAPKLGEIYREVRAEYYANGSADALMGNTVHVYRYIRQELGIPMRKGGDIDTEGVDAQLSRIYRAFERGGIIEPLLACFKA